MFPLDRNNRDFATKTNPLPSSRAATSEKQRAHHLHICIARSRCGSLRVCIYTRTSAKREKGKPAEEKRGKREKDKRWMRCSKKETNKGGERRVARGRGRNRTNFYYIPRARRSNGGGASGKNKSERSLCAADIFVPITAPRHRSLRARSFYWPRGYIYILSFFFLPFVSLSSVHRHTTICFSIFL